LEGFTTKVCGGFIQEGANVLRRKRGTSKVATKASLAGKKTLPRNGRLSAWRKKNTRHLIPGERKSSEGADLETEFPVVMSYTFFARGKGRASCRIVCRGDKDPSREKKKKKENIERIVDKEILHISIPGRVSPLSHFVF